MRIGSLFSGIGGLELGLEWSGIGKTIWQVEKCINCRAVLERHWPSARRYTDVKKVGRENLEYADLICGGFPCQDVSAAGKGAGLNGARSGLWSEFYRIVHELEPEWVVVENVASGAKRWVDAVRGGLELIGYETIPIPLSAEDVGAPHLRKRIFIIGQAIETWSLRRWRSGGKYTISHAKHMQLRNEQRRDSGASRQRETELTDYGEAGFVADSDSARELQQKRGVEEQRGWTCNKSEDVPNTYRKSTQRVAISRCKHSYWSSEPDVGRVANGIPRRMDRLRQLGNAVVPQCAQIIGEFVKQLHTDSVVSEERDNEVKSSTIPF
jgi:DNA (cytosine-5)-methyltransferase 1